jgi:hypothetical protein
MSSRSWTEGDAVTEVEWETCTDPATMLICLRGRASKRQYGLFCVACARDELDRAQKTQQCLNFGDPVSDSAVSLYWDRDRGYEAAILSAEAEADAGKPLFISTKWFVSWPIGEESAWTALGYDPDGFELPERIAKAIQGYQTHPAVYLRDIFGNPFRQTVVDPVWRTETVLSLARSMYESREFGAMPILADALQDAGCDKADILDHCRGPGPHVRGCWVVDLILGKE